MTQPQQPNALVTVTQALTAAEWQGKFQSVLPPEVPPDRFTTVVLTALQRNPQLLEADRQSLYNACVELAQRGMLPDGKQAALVTYNTNVAPRGKPAQWVKKVQAQAMVEGIIAEMGKVGIQAYANSVYEKDEYRFWNDDAGQHVEHKFNPFAPRGARIGSFASATLPNGRTYVEAMSMEELERVALRSKQAGEHNGTKQRGGTWASDPERMEQKTPLHRIRKRVPVVFQLPDDSDPDIVLDVPTEPAPAEPDAAPEKPPAPEGRVTNRPRGLQSVIDQEPQAEEAGGEVF